MKKWEIIKASKRSKVTQGIEYKGKKFKFGKSGAFSTTDAGLAQAIEDSFGMHSETGTGDVVVCEVSGKNADPGHYTFVVPALPWKREEA